MRTKPILANLTPYVPGKTIEEVKQSYGLERIVKLASNENPFGFSDYVKSGLQQAVEGLEIYPDGYARELRTTLSKTLSVNEKQLIFGNGSDEVVQIICRTFLEPGSNTVMATPTFPQYRHNALIEGAEVREVPLDQGFHNLSEMLKQIDEHTRVVWICNPNNPTGTMINQQAFESFMEQCPDNVLVVMDEAYVEYVSSSDFPDTLSALSSYNNLLITRTFSKAYGLAALRIGYGIASESIISSLEPSREPFNTSSLAQKAALLALEDQSFIEETYKSTVETKQELQEFCENNGLTYYPSETNFMLVHLPISGDEMTEYLLRNGFIVRSGEALGIPNSIRLTIGKQEHMEEIMDAMGEKLAESRQV
ncbi:histidinol-phosphate transaminase [Pontibacillus yanchengensis]|uniref:Histidinol-phosphate aminotransferase n=1 Tax=Pontibacillus yanchengensis Y32 TaxID=1385514 RepID=A0A0A2TFY5_9BACI|nr:histidinol-phosphate transaminase [Pontibacillus yanchengensis]KGP73016.1 histidinol-phosphate aminotransferase [Pontibacillus yanchengensis Y32]